MSNQSHKELQKAFAAHIRNPRRYPKPEGIDEQRMQVYRDLFFNNISSLIKQTFPVLATLYHPGEWSKLIRSFYQKQHNTTPYFTEIAGEFLQFLKDGHSDNTRPFLYELAHYEWLELSVEKDPRQVQFGEIKTQHLLTHVPLISPLVCAHSYHFPVHQIGPDYQPQSPQNQSHLMVWRDRHFDVHFAQLNATSLRLLQQLQQSKLTGHEAILSVLPQNPQTSAHKTLEFGRQQLEKWSQQDIIINTQ